MSESIRLIAGLGNPGAKYQKTWHNLGFRVIELLAERWKITFKIGKGEYLAAETAQFGGVTLLKPTSFMNRSGLPVGNWVRYRKVESNRLLVVYDDHDLPFGSIRIRESGSAGGHNGMADIIRNLQSEAVPRIRIGIRTESELTDLADQVLTPIPKRLEAEVESIISTAADAIENILTTGSIASGNRNQRLTIL